MVTRCRTSRLHWLLLIWLVVLMPLVCAAAVDDARALMQAAKENYDGGDHQRALTQFTQLVSRYPRSFEGQQAAYYQGRCLEQLGRPGEALRQYQNFLGSYPDSYLRSTAERRIRELQGGAPSPPVSPEPPRRPVPAPPAAVSPTVTPATTPQARPAAASASVFPVNHVIRPGETVSGLCQHYYGNAGYWRALAYHNRLNDPARVTVGQQLEFPAAPTLDGLLRAATEYYARPRGVGDSIPLTGPAAAPVAAPPVETVSVTVAETAAADTAAAPDELAALAQRLHTLATSATDPAVVEEAWLGQARIAVAAGHSDSALRHYRQAVQVRPGSDQWFAAMYQLAILELSARHDVGAAKAALEQLLGALPDTGQETLRGSALALLATLAGSPERIGEHELMGGAAMAPAAAPPTLSLNVLELPPQVRRGNPAAASRPAGANTAVPAANAPRVPPPPVPRPATAPAAASDGMLLIYDGVPVGQAAGAAVVPAPARPEPAAAARPPAAATASADGETQAMYGGFTAEDLQPPLVVEYIPAPDAPAPDPALPVVPVPVAAPPVPQPAAGNAPAVAAPAANPDPDSSATSPQNMRIQELQREALNLKGRGMYVEAESAYRAVLALDPENPETLNNLAYLYAEMGVRLAEAEEMVRRAMKNDALRVGYYRDTLGWVLFKKGDLVQAREELRRAAAYQDTAERYYHLGVVHKALGDTDEARRCLLTARELAGRSALAAEIANLLAELAAPPASS